MSATDQTRTRTGRVVAVGGSLAAVAAIVIGAAAFANGIAQPSTSEVDPPTPRSISRVIEPMSSEDEAIAVEARESARIEAERVAAEAAAAEAARVAAEQAAAAEASRIATEQQQTRQSTGGSGGSGGTAPAAPSDPVRCPAGSSANSSDGVNDTSCFPNICFSIAVPDAAHPECDVAFRP